MRKAVQRSRRRLESDSRYCEGYYGRTDDNKGYTTTDQGEDQDDRLNTNTSFPLLIHRSNPHRSRIPTQRNLDQPRIRLDRSSQRREHLRERSQLMKDERRETVFDPNDVGLEQRRELRVRRVRPNVDEDRGEDGRCLALVGDRELLLGGEGGRRDAGFGVGEGGGGGLEALYEPADVLNEGDVEDRRARVVHLGNLDLGVLCVRLLDPVAKGFRPEEGERLGGFETFEASFAELRNVEA